MEKKRWEGHLPGAISGIPGPDNPGLHQNEYRNAYLYSQGSILMYLNYQRAGNIDIDSSGTIGNEFIWSNPNENFGLALVELAGNIANARWTEWLE